MKLARSFNFVKIKGKQNSQPVAHVCYQVSSATDKLYVCQSFYWHFAHAWKTESHIQKVLCVFVLRMSRQTGRAWGNGCWQEGSSVSWVQLQLSPLPFLSSCIFLVIQSCWILWFAGNNLRIILWDFTSVKDTRWKENCRLLLTCPIMTKRAKFLWDLEYWLFSVLFAKLKFMNCCFFFAFFKKLL